MLFDVCRIFLDCMTVFIVYYAFLSLPTACLSLTAGGWQSRGGGTGVR